HNFLRIRHSITLRRQRGRILPCREDRATGRAEPKEAPHARDVHARQDDLPTRPLDLLSRRIEVVDAHVARAPRGFLRLRRSDSALPAAGRPEREVVAYRELHGLKAPAEDLLQEIPGRGRIGAGKLGESHRSVLTEFRSGSLPCHRPLSLAQSDIQWIVYMPGRGRTDSGAQAD